MTGVIVAIVIVVVVALIVLASALHIVQQYEKGVVFRFGRVTGEKGPGLVAIVPFVNVLRKVSLRIVTMPIQSQGIITRDNVERRRVGGGLYRVVDADKVGHRDREHRGGHRPDRPDNAAQGRRPTHPR